jgi:hypothetical protein
MKSNYILKISSFLIFLGVLGVQNISAQSFKQGSFNISISGGSTTANYATKNKGDVKNGSGSKKTMDGIRDPLILEYGLTNHWGIGMSLGNDIFEVDPNTYYGFGLPSGNKVVVNTSEFNFDLNYHIYTNERFDFSTFTSIGKFTINFTGKETIPPVSETQMSEDFNYNYTAQGHIGRIGTRAKFYVFKRIALMTMLSVYSGNATTAKSCASNTNVGNNYSTRITGYASEIGLSFRIR